MSQHRAADVGALGQTISAYLVGAIVLCACRTVPVEQPPPTHEPVSSESPPAPDPDPPTESRSEPAVRFTDAACATCKDQDSTHCLTRIDADGSEVLGCGEASPSGRYALITRETGDIEDDSWVLDYVYLDVSGVIDTVEGACTGSPSVDCEGPGRFVALEDGRWMQHMGNAGDGTNDQRIENIVSGASIELPEGEYDLVANPSGTVAAFLSLVPNIYADDGTAMVRATFGCFDARTQKVHVVWTEEIAEDASDLLILAEVAWVDGGWALQGEDNAPIRRLACPPASSTTAASGGHW